MRRLIPANRLRPALLGSVLISLALTGGMAAVRTFGSPLASRTYVVFLINVMLVVSFQLFIGNSGIVSFGHIAFMGVGAYTTALLTIPPAIKATQLPALPHALATAEQSYLPAISRRRVVAVLAAIRGRHHPDYRVRRRDGDVALRVATRCSERDGAARARRAAGIPVRRHRDLDRRRDRVRVLDVRPRNPGRDCGSGPAREDPVCRHPGDPRGPDPIRGVDPQRGMTGAVGCALGPERDRVR
jgi:hypothetical protein